MLKTQISREELNKLGEEIRSHFELSAVERGLEYQQKGYVYNTEVLPNRTIVSKVQGSGVYDVKLDLDFFGLSECSCPFDGYCMHMAAVFFYAYSVYGRPDGFIKDWRHRQEQPQFVQSGASKLHRQTALLASLQPAASSLKEASSAEEWAVHIQQELGSFSDRHNQYKYEVDEYYSAAVQTAVRPSTWWGPVPKRLLALYGSVYGLLRLEQDYAEGGFSMLHRQASYRETAEAMIDRLELSLEEIDAPETIRRFPEQVHRLGELVSETLAHRPGAMLADWLHVYRLLWSRLLVHQPAWTEQEVARLDRTQSEQDDWLAARAHFDVMAGADQQAWERFRKASSFHPRQALFYVRELQRTEQWERLWSWLEWLLPQCKRTDRDFFHALCQSAAEAAKQLDREREWLNVLASMLPASYSVYTEYLIKSGRIREWTDYHLYERISVNQIHPAELRAAEAVDPALIFPLYHQSIERCIMQKNRPSYKEATRLIKKLGSLYLKAGLSDRYDAYLLRLSLQFARLRAFQEELTKGKLNR